MLRQRFLSGSIVGKKPQKFCIYCGGSELTKEHLWSDWMRPLLPPSPEWSHTRTVLESSRRRGRSEVFKRHHKLYQGDVSTIRLRVVCRECNNGWMSALDKAAKPLLTGLITGANRLLEERDQRLIARWITMKLIVAEHGEMGAPVTTTEDRYALREGSDNPLEVWDIWIAQNQGQEWRNSFYRHAATLGSGAGVEPPRVDGLFTKNTQFDLFGVGQLLIVAISSYASAPLLPAELAHILRRIHPFQAAISWPPLAIIRDSAVAALQREFSVALDRFNWVPEV